MEGGKEVLGLWTSANEGAKFWLQVLTELSNRGVKDIFIACVDGLKGAAGGAIDAILSAAAMNFHKLLGALWRFFLCCVLKVYGGLQTISAPQVRQDQLLRARKRLFQDRLVRSDG